MALFSRGVPRWFAVGIVLTGFCVLPPEVLSRGPDLCLWRHLLHVAACPACGSLRALAAFFHGRFGDAFAYNPNVLVTGPGLIALAAKDAVTVTKKMIGRVGKVRR
jgi:hypothetical protein